MSSLNEVEQAEAVAGGRPGLPFGPRAVWRWLWPPLLLLALLFLALGLVYQPAPFYHLEAASPQTLLYLKGFYGPEQNQAFSYRWSKPRWEIELPLSGRRPYAVALSALSLQPAPVQVLDRAGQLIATFTPTAQLQTYRFEIPAGASADGDLRLTFQTVGFAPPGGGRSLGLLLTQLEISGLAGGGPVIPPRPALQAVALLGLEIYLLVFGLGVVAAGWKRRISWPFSLGLTFGLLACALVWLNRPGFVSFVLPLVFYLAIATGLIYFGLLMSLAISRLAAKKGEGEVEIGERPKPLGRENRLHPLALALVVLLGFGLRAIKLEGLPLFLDEGFHIQGAFAARSGQLNAAGLFYQAADGKALHAWVLAGIYELTGLAGSLEWARLFSALCGVITLLTCYKLGETLFSRRAGWLAAALWAILPYEVWHERVALVDPLVTTCAGLVLYFSLRLLAASSGRAIIGYSTLVGLALAVATLAKLPGLILAVIPALALLCLYRAGRWPALVARLGPVYALFWLTTVPVINLYDDRWNSTPQKLNAGGIELASTLDNLPKLVEAIYAYFTLPLLIGVVLAAGWAIPQNWRVGAFLLTLTLLFTLILSLLARNFYPRYLVFAFLPWLVLAAGGADNALRRLPKPGLALGGIVLVCLPALWLNYQLIANPLEAPLPSVDRFQFIEGWPAGSGLGEVKNFLLVEQTRQPIRVLATQYIPYNGLAVLLSDQPNLPVIYAETALARSERPIKQALKTGLAFFVMLEPDDLETLAAYQAAYPAFQFHLVLSVPRPGDHYRLKVYRLDPR